MATGEKRYSRDDQRRYELINKLVTHVTRPAREHRRQREIQWAIRTAEEVERYKSAFKSIDKV